MAALGLAAEAAAAAIGYSAACGRKGSGGPCAFLLPEARLSFTGSGCAVGATWRSPPPALFGLCPAPGLFGMVATGLAGVMDPLLALLFSLSFAAGGGCGGTGLTDPLPLAGFALLLFGWNNLFRNCEAILR